MPAETKPHTLTGEFRTHARFRSSFLPGTRTILVYLPPGYKPRAARRYPTLYLQDGQNVFDKATSFGEEWHVDETAQSLIEQGQIEPLIVVAIYNTGEHRVNEYTPTKVADKGGGSAKDDPGTFGTKPKVTVPSKAPTALEKTDLIVGTGAEIGGEPPAVDRLVEYVWRPARRSRCRPRRHAGS